MTCACARGLASLGAPHAPHPHHPHPHHGGGGFRRGGWSHWEGPEPRVIVVEARGCQVWGSPVPRTADTLLIYEHAARVTSASNPHVVEWPYLFSWEAGGVVVRRCEVRGGDE